ncbi:MAG: Lrp/AsnC family transcriptional regulator [Candidatus Bathyarchaeota archaeon]|nr:MAG: Lrp/AsnC family transcriptional regulator [Candidatus Bathyarchaeota archaeon]
MHQDKIPRLLYELIRNSRRSDRDLAKALGFSQPTVTRTRRRLEDEEYVLQYTAVPDFTKLGFEIMAFTFTQWGFSAESPWKWLKEDPRTVYVAEGNGLNGKNLIAITLHKNFTDYSSFVASLRERPETRSASSFIVALEGVRKHLNFSSLEEVKTLEPAI